MSPLARIAVVLALLAWSLPAAADSRTDAERLLREGNALADQGDHLGSLAKYRAAYALYPSFTLWLNIGTALRELGRNAEALEAYERFLAHPDAEAAKRAELGPILADLSRAVGTVRVTVQGPHRRVVVSGQAHGPASVARRFRVDPGSHSVVAECAEAGPTAATVTIGAAEERPVELRCEPKAAVPSSGAASGPGAAPGNVRRVTGYAVGALGLLELGIGAGFGVHAIVTQDRALSWCTDGDRFRCTQEGVDLNRTARTSAAVSTVAVGVGAASLALGIALSITAPAGGERAGSGHGRLTVFPVVGPGWATAQLGGQY